MPDASESDALPPWIRIVSPSQGDTVENPVTISFEGGGGVTHVTIEADNWPLHSDPVALGEGSITYSFTGVGFERTLLATGLDAGGTAVATDQLSFTPVNPKSNLVFPIDLNKPGLTLSHFDSPQSTGSFGAARSGGRLHAGCDLYWTNDGGYAYQASYYQYNDNTPIYAVADGTITGYAAFYQGTHALVVDHVDFVIRYGEVDDGGLPGGLKVGSKVTAGQLIAYMGDLDMSSGAWSMLHFELFSGELTGALTNTSNMSYLHIPNGNYQRRGDLMDCGPFLRAIMNP
jgi:murein DD-endopeptidase MepM/ murein hydrolase activator NlpD